MKNLLYIIPLAFLISCSGKKTDNTENEELQEAQASIESVEFSKEQIDLAGIKTGKFEKKIISETIECSGIIEVPPQNIAAVSPIIGGFIKNLNYYPGDYVEKGVVLGTLNHPDFKLHDMFILPENYDIHPERFTVIEDDEAIIEVKAKKLFEDTEKPYYRIKIEGS